MASVEGLWGEADFFKGFLTARWRLRQLSFVVLACEKEEQCTVRKSLGCSFGISSSSPALECEHHEDHQISSISSGSFFSEGGEISSTCPSVSTSPLVPKREPHHVSAFLTKKKMEEKRATNQKEEASMVDQEMQSDEEEEEERRVQFSSRHLLHSPVFHCHSSIDFYIFHRRDVEEPSEKFVGEPDKLLRCFFGCMEKNCSCKRLHVRENAWRIHLNNISQTSPLVCYNECCVMHLTEKDVIPTAGYYYALGLRSEGVEYIFPRLCSRGASCECGAFCLCIHLSNPSRISATPCTACTHLSSLLSRSNSLDILQPLLTKRSLSTVGDIQMLSSQAFDALVGEAPQETLEDLLSISTCRFFDPQSALLPVVSTFPRVPVKKLAELLAPYPLVLDVLKLSPSELYASSLPSVLTNVFEIIRKRMSTSEPFQFFSLEDVDPAGFIALTIEKVLCLARQYAHSSWRRHDPTRPLVTSMITFVDVTKCRCGLRMNTIARQYPSTEDEKKGGGEKKEGEEEQLLLYPGVEMKERLPAPYGSWCECPRLWETAVNYEMSTPMGSRCSEQNAMGAIARCGVPTWALREVVVHGNRASSDMNPLFPCGVCENMLRKVEKDVRKWYGKPLMLYMFDATSPSKVFSLPICEISLRDNPRFMALMNSEK